MNETLKWAAGRILFVMSLLFSALTWIAVGAAFRDMDYRVTVLSIAIASVVCWTGFMFCYMTRRQHRG